MPLTESGWYGAPKETVLPTSTFQFVGCDIACPAQSDAYLRILYGEFEEIELTYVDAAAAEFRRLVDADASAQPKCIEQLNLAVRHPKTSGVRY